MSVIEQALDLGDAIDTGLFTDGDWHEIEQLAASIAKSGERLGDLLRRAVRRVLFEAPAEQAPAEQAPTEKMPAEQTPTEQAPTEQTPAEQPAEEA